MFDTIALILITIFVPLIVLVGSKLYGYKNYDKLIKIFAILLFAFDLFRFFYNARFYANATTPDTELKFSYLTLYSIILLFASYNNGKLGDFFRKVGVLTCLIPFALGLFNSSIYTSSLDTYGVLKACYFIESGLSVLVSILIIKKGFSLKVLDIAFAEGVAVFYILINFLANFLWYNTVLFSLSWGLMVLSVITSVGLVFLTNFVLKKLCKKHTEKQEIKEEVKEEKINE